MVTPAFQRCDGAAPLDEPLARRSPRRRGACRTYGYRLRQSARAKGDKIVRAQIGCAPSMSGLKPASMAVNMAVHAADLSLNNLVQIHDGIWSNFPIFSFSLSRLPPNYERVPRIAALTSASRSSRKYHTRGADSRSTMRVGTAADRIDHYFSIVLVERKKIFIGE